MKYVIAVTLLCFCLVAGCGGGGGGGGGNSEPNTIPLSSTLRTMLPGDQMVYSVEGTISNGVQSTPIIGTMTRTLTSNVITTPLSVQARVLDESLILTDGVQTIIENTKSYITQSTNGTLWSHGGQDTDGNNYWITSPVTGRTVSILSPMTIGSTWGEPVQFSNGSTRSSSRTVVATGIITVSGVDYEIFRLSYSDTFSGLPSTGTQWCAPQLGGYVAIGVIATDADQGLTMSLAIGLTDSNRSPSEPSNGVVHTDMKSFMRAVIK